MSYDFVSMHRHFPYRFVIGQYVTVAGDVISHVNISRVAVEDGGTYECAAENRVGRATHSAPLRVYGKKTLSSVVLKVWSKDPYGSAKLCLHSSYKLKEKYYTEYF
jgi:hypothetical protein